MVSKPSPKFGVGSRFRFENILILIFLRQFKKKSLFGITEILAYIVLQNFQRLFFIQTFICCRKNNKNPFSRFIVTNFTADDPHVG